MFKPLVSSFAAALVCAAAAAPLAAQGQPPASPAAQVMAKVGAASLTIDYSRPSMRGRAIMGGLVPFDKVWRTGANRATHLKVDGHLKIGDLDVPSGTYTIYTIPGAQGWTLIVNKQTGQWGTQYDQAQDLGRVKMSVDSLPTPVEQFTIAVSGSGSAGTLTMEWEKTRASVALSSK